jgi:hypothetical protein
MIIIGNYKQNLTTRISKDGRLILAVLFSLFLVHSASARDQRVKGSQSLIDLELCRLSSDEKKHKKDFYENNQWGQSCCSKEQGFCIHCERGKNYCVKSGYQSFKKPEVIIQQPAGDVLAPTEDKPKPRFPGKMQKLPNNSTGTVIN